MAHGGRVRDRGGDVENTALSSSLAPSLAGLREAPPCRDIQAAGKMRSREDPVILWKFNCEDVRY